MKTQHKYLIQAYWIFVWIVGTASATLAQQDAQYTQFFANQLILNPAYAGSRDCISLTALYRNQWTGFPGAPTTQTVSLHAPIFKGSSGAGMSLLHDKIGITDNSILSGAYAYRIDLGGAHLALGLNGELRLQQMNWALANPLEAADPSISYTQRSLLLPNFGTGVYLNAERYYVGLSIPHLLEPALRYASPNQSATHLAQLRRHFFLSSGLALNVSESIVFRPQLLLKYVAHAPLQADINLGLVLKDKVWVGTTFRTHDSMDFFLQYSFSPRLRVGYAFDFSVTAMSPYQSGSHELLLSMDLGKSRNGFFHPRYF